MGKRQRPSAPEAEIVAIGTELLTGLLADTNSQYLTQRLLEEGVWCKRITIVPDIPRDIIAALEESTRRSQTVIVTGGLGPTLDDLTRQCVAKFSHRPLELRRDVLAFIEELFRRRHPSLPMPPRNRVQAMFPRGAEVLPNSIGTAAGFRLALDRSELVVMPGVPAEMKQMFETHVVPHLGTHLPLHRTGGTRTMNAFGVPESSVNERLRDIMGSHNGVDIGTIASEGVIKVRITVMATDKETLREKLCTFEDEVRKRLGEHVFGTGGDRLEHAVARELEARALTLAVAESCTGGLVSHRLTEVPGISRFLIEAQVTYSNDSKTRRLGVPKQLMEKHGAVSREVAAAMASGVRSTAGADYGLSVTGIAGPSGGSDEKPVGLCYVGCASASGTTVSEYRFGGSRETIKDRAAKSALYQLLLALRKAAPTG